MIKRILLSSLLFLIASSVYGTSLSLSEIKGKAKLNNYRLKAATVDSEIANTEKNLSKVSFLPKFGIKYESEKSKQGQDENNYESAYLYGRVNLFNGFKDYNKYKKKQLSKKKSESSLKELDFKLSLKIEKLYYTYLSHAKHLDITNMALKRNSKHLVLIRKRLASSLVTKTDLLEFELRKSKLLSKKEFLELELQDIKEELFLTAGIKDPIKYKIDGFLPHFEVSISLEDILKTAEESSEKLVRLALDSEINLYDLGQSKSKWYPAIDLETRYGNLSDELTNLPNQKNASQVLVSVNWELFSGGESVNGVKKAMLLKKKNTYLYKQEVQDTNLFLKAKYKKILALESRILAEEKNLKIAAELYSRTKKEYKRGIKDSGAMASAGEELHNINESIYELKHSYITTKLVMESVLGKSIKFKMIKHH